jgi:phospholipase C
VYLPGIYKNEPTHVRSYCVAAADTLNDSWRLGDFEDNAYHLRVYGPNGFYREFKGTGDDPAVEINCGYETLTGNLLFQINADKTQKIEITDNAYKNRKRQLTVTKKASVAIDVSKSYGWYDFTVSVKGNASFEKRFAGRVETGRPSKTDPFMGRVSV